MRTGTVIPEAAIDWDAARRRLRASEQALEAALTETPERIEAAYRKRAVQLAGLGVVRGPAAPGLPALVFRLGEERYAIELSEVAEVIPLAGCIPVPGAPRGIVGVIDLRGDLLPVFDLLTVFEPGGPTAPSANVDDPANGGSYVLVLRHEERRMGLKVHRIEALIDVRPGEPIPMAGATHGRGLLPGKSMLLDVEAILADVFRGAERFSAEEEF